MAIFTNVNGNKIIKLVFKNINNIVLLSLSTFFIILIALSIFNFINNTKEGLEPGVKTETDDEKKARESIEAKQNQDKQLKEIEDSNEKELRDDENYPPTKLTKEHLPEPLKEE